MTERRFQRLIALALILVSVAGAVLVAAGLLPLDLERDSALLFPLGAVVGVVGLHSLRPRPAQSRKSTDV